MDRIEKHQANIHKHRTSLEKKKLIRDSLITLAYNEDVLSEIYNIICYTNFKFQIFERHQSL